MAPKPFRKIRKLKDLIDPAKLEALIQERETPIVISGPGMKDQITTAREIRIKQELAEQARNVNSLMPAEKK